MRPNSIIEVAAEELITAWLLGNETQAVETLTDMIDNLDDQLKALRSMREVLLSPELPRAQILTKIKNSYRDGNS